MKGKAYGDIKIFPRGNYRGLIGLGAIVVAPVVLPVVSAVVQPLIKGLIWGVFAD
jgi:hypothetical protein